MGRASPPAAGRAHAKLGHVGRSPRRELCCLAALLRSTRRAEPARPDLRRPPLGRRQFARLRRSPGRLGEQRPDSRCLRRSSGAAGPPSGLGRREAECRHRLGDAAQRRRDGGADRRAARADSASGRDPGDSACARGRQPPLRGAVRPHASRARGRRACLARDSARHHRGETRHPSGGREGASPGCRGDGKSLLARRRCRDRRAPPRCRRDAPAPARAQGLHPQRTTLFRRRRDRVRVSTRAGAGRCVCPDSPGCASGEAPPCRWLDRVALGRPGRRSCGDACAPLPRGARVRPRSR